MGQDNEGVLRKQFEEDLIKLYQLKRCPLPSLARKENAKGGSQHSYIDKKVQQMWRGYKLHHEMRYSVMWVSPQDIERPLGKYVVARINEIGVPQFSRHPYRHALRKDAVAEAQRLGVEFNARFAVFRCIELTGKKPLVSISDQLKTIVNISEV